MITKDNIKDILKMLSKEELNNAFLNIKTDYFLLSLSVFNAGTFATLEEFYPMLDDEDEATSDGSLIVDFGQLETLFNECDMDIYKAMNA